MGITLIFEYWNSFLSIKGEVGREKGEREKAYNKTVRNDNTVVKKNIPTSKSYLITQLCNKKVWNKQSRHGSVKMNTQFHVDGEKNTGI